MGTIFAQYNDVNKLAILNQYRFFNNATGSLQRKILANAEPVTLKTDTYFFRRGFKVRHLALIGSGSVRVFMTGESGREATLYHVEPGDACPINILSILLNREAPVFAMVESLLHAVIIDACYFREWVATDSIIRDYVFETLLTRISDDFSLLENLKFRKLETRLAEYLVKQLPQSEMSPAVIRVTHERLASELGSAREVISRLLREFERLGFVELARGRIFINDRQALRDIVKV